jgi:conjugal transfer/entry exclusion protein
MRRLTRRRSLAVALLTGALGTCAPTTRTAEADLFGGDLPLLAGILAEAVVQVSNLVSIVTQVVEEVNLMKTMVTGLDSGSFSALMGFIQAARTTYGTLTSGIRSMSYSLDRVDREYQALFPAPTQATTVAEHAQYYTQWNQEVLAASQVAAREQTVLETLEDRADKARDLVQQSKDASGELAQLQLVVQMLGILHTELLSIHQTLATTGRVLTDMAAASASSSQLSQTKKQSSLANYTSKGDAVNVPHRLP